MIFDAHLHTKFSADSQMQIVDAIKAANDKNIGLVLTEHLDYDFPGDDLFEFDPQQYMSEYAPYRSNKLYLGVEVGMQQHTAQRSIEFVKQADFDEVICSLHVIDGQDLYYKSCYDNKDQKAVYTKYLTLMAQLIRQHDFADILGHIDYICRYAPYNPPDIIFADYQELIDDIWLTLIDKGIVPELNTRRFNNSNNIPTLLKLYERYAQLGGKYVSLGSDAHTPENIGFKLYEAANLLTNYNLQPVYFVNRQMQISKI